MSRGNSKRRQAPIEVEAESPRAPAPPVFPAHWVKGQLLDLKRFTDGSYQATLLGEEAKPDGSNVLHFDSGFAAQNFVSAWYTPAPGRWN